MIHVVDVKNYQYDSIERSKKNSVTSHCSVRSKKILIKYYYYVTKWMFQTNIKTMDECFLIKEMLQRTIFNFIRTIYDEGLNQSRKFLIEYEH
jgi:hypothetical protein